jgi:C-terminal peptidase prc
LWQAVNQEYLYADFNGLDWEAVFQEFMARIEVGLTGEAFYDAMDEMIARLGDDHSFFLDPTEVAQEEEEYAGTYDYVGIGVLVVAIPERNLAVVLLTFPDSPAEELGLLPRDNILAVDNQPILDENGFLQDIIRGPEGSSVLLAIQTPGEDVRQITIQRRRITSTLQLPFSVLNSPNGKRIGYILMPTFADSNVDRLVGEALVAMSGGGPLDGLILDNRWNRGGVDTVMRGTLAYFIDGLVGHFINHSGERALLVNGQDLRGSQDMPLLVLVGPDTASFGEIFSGILQDLERAYLIGEITGGNVETLWGYDFSDGSRAWIAHDSFRPLNNPEQDWEQNGIVPDEQLKAPWFEFTLREDPVVREALDYLDSQ